MRGPAGGGCGEIRIPTATGSRGWVTARGHPAAYVSGDGSSPQVPSQGFRSVLIPSAFPFLINMLHCFSFESGSHSVRPICLIATLLAEGTAGGISMRGKLTSLGVGRLKTPGKYYDGQYGFFVQVFPSGAKCWHPSLTLAHTFLRRTGGGGTENQGVAEVVAGYRSESHRYMYGERRSCMTHRVRVPLDTCTCASPTRSAPMAPC